MSGEPRMIRAYKFLQNDFRSGCGSEGPWAIGETRTHHGELILCQSGYHWSRNAYDALGYASGNVLSIVLVSDDGVEQSDKGCSHVCQMVAFRNVERELRLWGCDCAERAIDLSERNGQKADPRSRNALAVARRYADGQATREELRAAREAASRAAWAAALDAAWVAALAAALAAAGDAAWVAARDAAWAAAWAAAGDAAWVAARDAEIDWQRQHLVEMLDPLFKG